MPTTILGTIDAGGEGKAVLLAALNQALGKNFTLAEFTFSDPVAITIPTPTRNTMIKLAPLAASGYYGVRKVYYNRIHVSELGQIVVSRGAATRVSDLLPQINEKYGVYIQPTDIYDGLLPAEVPGETEVQITLNFRPSSIIFYGGVQIILGSNDPNSGGGSGGGTVLPFAGETMLFTTQATKRLTEGGPDETFIIDPFSTYIDADKTRKRFGSVVDETGSPSFDKFFKRSYLAADWLALEKKELIVFSWRNAINEVFALNIYGDVYKAALNGLSWSFVSNVLDLTYVTQGDVEEVQAYRPIVHAGRAPTGEIYVVYALAGTAFYVRKSTDDGTTWTEVYGVGVTENQGYNISGYESGALHYEDSIIHGGKLWTIVHSTNPYNAKPGSEPAGPAVECLDLTTFAMDYFTLGEVFAKYSQQNFELVRGECRLTFVTPENDLVAFPRVAALARMRNSSRMFLIMYTKNGDGYEAEVVGNATLSRELLDDTNRFISAYSIPLQKDDTLSLDVIELGCRVPTNTLPYETYAMGVRERTQNAFKVYGVKVYTSVRGGTARNAWVESNVSLGDGSAHKRIIINTPSKRMHFVAQPENALARMRFTEDNAIAGFRATADVSITLDKHSGFSTLSGHGSGIYSNPVILETLNTSYGLTEFVDEESTKLPINYSFIARDQQDNYKWLVSALPNSPLQERTFSREYSYIGKIPLLVASNGADLFVWSQFGNGIYRSGNSGNFWEFNGQTEVFYNQTLSDKPERNILGMAEIAVKPERFKNGSFIGDNSIIDIEFAESAKVTDSVSLEFDKVVSFNDRVLFSNNGLPNATNRGYDSQTALGGYGVNFYGAFAPKKLLAWETDSTNNAAIGASMITTDNAQPYGELYGRSNYSANIENDFVVLDINTKVKFLDINQIIYGYRIIGGNEVHMLKLVDNSDVVTTVELFGGSNPSLNTFKPKAAFGLWEFADANYVPYIYYDDKKILLITRLREDGTFTNTIHLINVPADNGGALDIVPMFNANRREYYFAQRSNGIFKLNYTYNALTKTAVLSLNRVFTLNGTAANLTIVSGTVRELPVVIEPTVPLIPTFPPNGTLISTFCDGTTKTGVYADGSGGTYNQVVELESPDCGFSPGTPTPVGATTTTMTLNTTSATADLIETSVVAAEDGTAYAIYELSAGLNADTNVVLSMIAGSATSADINSVAYRIGSGSFITASLPQTITIPSGETELVVRIKYVQDNAVEGDEIFTLRLAKSAGNTQITNTDPIDTVFTINDSFIVQAWPVVTTASYLDDFENANKSWPGFFVSDTYDVQQSGGISTGSYDAANKHMRISMANIEGGGRNANFLVPYGISFIRNMRLTVDIDIPKVRVRNLSTLAYLDIDYDDPLPANHQYVDSTIGIGAWDDNTGATNGTAIEMLLCRMNNALPQRVLAGTGNTVNGPSERQDTSLGTLDMPLPRGGKMRLVLEVYTDGGVKRHKFYLNGQLLLNFTSGPFATNANMKAALYIGRLSANFIDIRRYMIEDMDVATANREVTPAVWSPSYMSSGLSNIGTTLSNGNRTADITTGMFVTTYAAGTGKYYAEATIASGFVGIAMEGSSLGDAPGSSDFSIGYRRSDGVVFKNNSTFSTALSANATIVRMFIDTDNKILRLYTDANATAVVVPFEGENVRIAGNGNVTINAGQVPFTYAVPFGYTPGFGPDLDVNYDQLAFAATTLNRYDMGDNIVLTDDCLGTVSNAYGSGVRAKMGISSGKWAWEVRPNIAGSEIVVGIGRKETLLESNIGGYPGAYDGDWGYYGGDGSKVYGGDIYEPYGATFGPGDVVTVLLDMDNGVLSFMKNGVSQGIMATGLTGTFYPQFGAFNGNLNVNFGQTPFAFPVPYEYTQGVGVKTIVPTKWNSVAAAASSIATIGNAGSSVNFAGSVTGNVKSYKSANAGKWAWEVKVLANPASLKIGIADSSYTGEMAGSGGVTLSGSFAVLAAAFNGSLLVGDIVTVLFNRDAGTVEFMKNGAVVGSPVTGISGYMCAAIGHTTPGSGPIVDANFGERPFTYAIPGSYAKGFGYVR
jgi:hypothetical protein